MLRLDGTIAASVLFAAVAFAQVEKLPPTGKEPAKSEQPPRYDDTKTSGESSSRDTQVDISPPEDDAKNHPFSSSSVDDAEAESSGDVQEMRLWNPHRAAKNIEVGDFYFKRKNYKAALERYHDALKYKPDDALANYRLAQCFEKLDDPDQAADHYQQYLKIMPNGEFAEGARKALGTLRVPERKDQPAEKAQAK